MNIGLTKGMGMGCSPHMENPSKLQSDDRGKTEETCSPYPLFTEPANRSPILPRLMVGKCLPLESTCGISQVIQ